MHGSLWDKLISALPLDVLNSSRERRGGEVPADCGREACRAKKLLANRRIHEAWTLLQLYKVRALRSERQLKDAEINVGRAHLAIWRSGYYSGLLDTELGGKRNDSLFQLQY